MGSGVSKASSSGGSGSGCVSSRRSRAHRVFRSSCFGSPSRSRDTDNDDQVCYNKKTGTSYNVPCRNQTGKESGHVKISGEFPCMSSNIELDEWTYSRSTDTGPRNGSSAAQASSTQSLSSSSRFLSRFRLRRATSLGSSAAYSHSSSSLTILNNEEELHLDAGGGNSSLVNRREDQGSYMLPTDTSGNIELNIPASNFSVDMQEGTVSSVCDITGDVDSTSIGTDVNLQFPRFPAEIVSRETRFPNRRIPQEPIEHNVQFSRTLSVGRLRDRVIRRSSLSDLTFFPPQQERDATQGREGRAWGSEATSSTPGHNAITSSTTSVHPTSSMSSSLFNIHDYEGETSRSREARYHDLLEYRSNFQERRRRIRSQVRALQRLGSRFENVSGHERSCVLSGQHRSGHCTCHITNRNGNSNDDTTARASISRIVMLAEALFEVLDEIHQQSMVLSSRPSVSPLGSVPAPHEVVELLPIKIYSISQNQHNEEAAQCYICLVEYEEGDCMRILPCQHEFHRACIDKWLKDIHRVCPLCRGDICRSDLLPAQT